MLAYESPIDTKTPRAYAERLALYLNDPQAIYIACRREFGTDGVPSKNTIAGMIELRKAKNKPAVEVADNDDGAHWAYRAPVPSRRLLEAVQAERAPLPADFTIPPPVLLMMFPGELVAKVARDLSIPIAELTGKRRFRRLVAARTVAAMLLKERGLSYPQIGRFLGGRDHSTTINLVKMFPVYCMTEPLAWQVYVANGGRA